MKRIVTGFVGLLITTLSCGPASAYSHASGGRGSWSASNSRGGSASGGGGSWSASGAHGGSASGGGGSWSGEGGHGGSASGGGGSWSGEGGHGGSASGGGGSWSATSGGTAYHSTTAYHSSTYYGAHYSTYHPPTTVNYYGSSCGSCGGWSTAGAAAAGAAVGVVAGAAVASANTNAAASNAYASGYVAGSAANPTYAMGAIYATLPPGCATPTVQGVTYYLCGNTWFQPSYGANGVYYRVVPTP